MSIFQISRNKPLSFLDVLRFSAGYWFQQPKKLFFILIVLLFAAFLETYLPNALAEF